jgi:hypothetical protein
VHVDRRKVHSELGLSRPSKPELWPLMERGGANVFDRGVRDRHSALNSRLNPEEAVVLLSSVRPASFQASVDQQWLNRSAVRKALPV